MSKMIPHSVVMRKRGYTFNSNAKSWTSPWVLAVETLEARINYRARVNKTVDVLTRFVATWVTQSRAMRSAQRIREAGEKWRNAALFPNWANMMEEEESRIAVEEIMAEAERQDREAAFEARLIAMPEAELIAYHQRTMTEHRIHHEDYRPWLHFIAMIHRKRMAHRVAFVDNAQMWVELNARPVLHNQQRPAQVRRVIPRNAFGALEESSDSE